MSGARFTKHDGFLLYKPWRGDGIYNCPWSEGYWNAVEIIGVIHRIPLCQSVSCKSRPACLNRFRVCLGKTQCVAKPLLYH